jgi:outer membrane lipoprotein-sorting protein
MKFRSSLSIFSFILLGAFGSLKAQTVDEIIQAYYNVTGGSNWEKVTGMRMTANIEQQGMNIPFEIISLKDGRMCMKMTLTGNTMTLAAFDGKTSWTTNWMTMEPEESPAEVSENAKRAIEEFPNPLFNYKALGYSASVIGDETVEGTACYKIKLDKKTELADGKEVPNIEYYYIDKENNVVIMVESEITSGEMKGNINQTKLSDYQEVSGVYIPFSTTEGVKGQMSQTIQFETVEINPTVEESIFVFPKK